MLDIFKAVTVPDAHLVIAGDGPLRKETETKFHSSPSASRAHFVGSLSRSAVMDWYQSADVFLLPSEEEGSPHALIEALAYGLPSVVSDVGGVRETMTETLSDWVLPYGDTAQLAHKISLLLSDKTLYQTVAHQSKIVAKNYSKSKK